MVNNLMKQKVVLVSVLLLFFSCTPRIVRYEYNKNFRGFMVYVRDHNEGNYTVIARQENGAKIQEEKEVWSLIKKFNTKAFRLRKTRTWDLSEKKKYDLADLYYEGLRAYEKNNYKDAIKSFHKAIEQDKKIVRYSDILYLLAKSYFYTGDKENASKYFKEFLEYSESISNHNLRYSLRDDNGEKLNELFMDAESHLAETPKDAGPELGLRYHEEPLYPKYKNRYFNPGFTKDKYFGPPELTFGLYYDPGSEWGAYARYYLSVLNGMDLNIHYLYASYYREFYLGVPFRLFTDVHQRFGIKLTPSFYYISRYLKESEPERTFWKSYCNGGVDLSLGFYINHYWFLYTGYKYNYYNKSDPYTFRTEKYIWKIWLNNNYYAGTTVYFFGELGAGLAYSYEDVIAYFEMSYFQLGYNFTQKDFYFSYVSLGL
ncbi:MAG: hypothetical protein PHF84_02570 [bacterium]|nr:hypothetical protein [bacterium]